MKLFVAVVVGKESNKAIGLVPFVADDEKVAAAEGLRRADEHYQRFSRVANRPDFKVLIGQLTHEARPVTAPVELIPLETGK